MFILTVIPIGKGIPKDNLTYFTKSDAPTGSIVSIPLRNRTIYGLVVANRTAQEIKSELKSLTYSIRKIDNIETRSFLSNSFIEAAKKIADYNAGSVGSVLFSLIPNIILENSSDLSLTEKKSTTDNYHETCLLQSDDEERYATYKSLIREEFAKGRSVFFCLPTTEDLLNAKNTLEKGIEKYTFTLHSGLPKKDILKNWKDITLESHPVLIISTGSFLCLPRNDLGSIIIERESSRAYKMQTRPYIDIRQSAEMLAKELGIRLILGDNLLRVETLWNEKRGKYAEISSIKYRSLTTANCELVSMRVPADMKKKEFMILGDKTIELLAKALENNEKTFLFCGRKGLYPTTVCSDCGTTVVCKNCSAPVVLYGKKNVNGESKNLFVCHHCGERDDAMKLCIKCGGWRLTPLGIGIDRIEHEITKLFPKSKVIVMDKDHVSTHKQAVKIRDEFYDTPGGIMIGTEMAITYLNQKIENSIVISVDSYLSIPDFQINEKVFHILLAMRNFSEKNFLIQTRQENTKLFDHALRGNLMDFYRDEIEDRKSIGYPPFSTYIKVSLEGEKNVVKKEMEEIVEFMKPYELQSFDAFSPGTQKKYTVHGLIVIKSGDWPDQKLLEKLRILQPHCSVRIDPATLL